LIFAFNIFYQDILPMLKYLANQLTKCEESLRKQIFNENKGGRLAFLTDIQLFDLITSGRIRIIYYELCLFLRL
jgi:hypothetical protein